MRLRIYILVGVFIMVSIATGTVYAMKEPSEEVPRSMNYDISNIETEMYEVQEIIIIASDLMMALDLKERFLSGEENLISFADGTEIKMNVPSSVISQLDAQIEKLKLLLVERVDAKKKEWIPEEIPGDK